MKNIGANIKYLRKQLGMSQEAFAEKIGLTRAVIGSYEEERAVPRIGVLQQLSKTFDISIDCLVNQNLWENNSKSAGVADFKVLTTVVDKDNKEQIIVVPAEASAGYTTGYADPDYIRKLPVFHLPIPELTREKTYRLFQIKGDSMQPITSGSYIICEYILDMQNISDGQPCIVLTRDDGIVFKRLYTQLTGLILLKSDNPDYRTYEIKTTEVLEIWKALGYISFQLPEKDDITIPKLHQMMIELKQEVNQLKKK